MKLPLDNAIIRNSDSEVSLEIFLAQDHPVFNGHFDEAPVLAGVSQVDWVMQLAHQVWPALPDFCGLPSVKFLALIAPPLTIKLNLHYQKERGVLKFTYSTLAKRYSQGLIRLASHEIAQS